MASPPRGTRRGGRCRPPQPCRAQARVLTAALPEPGTHATDRGSDTAHVAGHERGSLRQRHGRHQEVGGGTGDPLPGTVVPEFAGAWSACRRARTHAAAEAGFSQSGTATSRKAPAAARTVPSLAPDIATECHEEHPVDMPQTALLS